MKYFPGASILVGGADNVLLLADDTVPTLSSAAINAAGTQLTLTFSEICQHALALTLTATNGNFTLGLADIDKTNVDPSKLVYNLSGRTLLSGETVTLTCAQGAALDTANNRLAAQVASAVTNSSTQTTTTTTTTT